MRAIRAVKHDFDRRGEKKKAEFKGDPNVPRMFRDLLALNVLTTPRDFALERRA